MEIKKENRCTLTDEQLIFKIGELVGKLSKTGGKSWSLSVPVDFNRDPDMIFVEAANRILEKNNQIKELEPKWIDVNKELPKEGNRYWCYIQELNDGGWWSYYQWNCSYNESTNEWGDTDGNKVTHWTELLPPPK